MTDHEFEQLLSADSEKFTLKWSFTALRSEQFPTKPVKHRTIGVSLKYGLVISLGLLFAGSLIYKVLDTKPNTATAAGNVSDALSTSTVNQMVNYASSYRFPFTVYVPVGGLGASDYQVKAESGLPGGVEFVLWSKQRQTFISIEEYSSSQELPPNRHPWIKITDSLTGQTYWQRINVPNINDYYFMKGSTKIMVEENHPFNVNGEYFPTNMFHELKPLSSFATDKVGTGQPT